jgi:tetratricopeptide (TPR) repeat protein
MKRLDKDLVLNSSLLAVMVLAACFFVWNSKREAGLVLKLIAQGEISLRDERYDEAILQFTKATRLDSMNTRAHLGSADALLHLGKKGDAVGALESMIEAAGNMNLSHDIYAACISDMHGYISTHGLCMAAGMAGQAQELSQRALTPGKLLEQSEIHLSRHEYNNASRLLEWLIAIDPENVRAYLDYADACFHSIHGSIKPIALITSGAAATGNESLSLLSDSVIETEREGFDILVEAYDIEGWRDKGTELLERLFEETNEPHYERLLKDRS